MALFKCKMCGGDLELAADTTVAECEYCGTKQTVPTADNEKKITLFTRANRLRAACEFDKAAGIYESIVADFPEEAEAYWGLILCQYGIEYVDDPATGNKVPTCHRSSFESLMDDPNFEQVMEYSDPMSRRVYRDEAKAIEEIRKRIIEVSGKEEPYDIFICYKETGFDGNRTLDSVLAQDIYDALTEKGYRVFFSRITLEDKLGVEYEPYIFAALNSAKVMLAVGTDYEYYNAVWVKNEWSRYLKLIASGQKKALIPCFKGIDAYDMPKEFARLQAQDLGKVGAMQDLLRGIEKILGAGNKKVTASVVQQGSNTSSLLQRAFMFLEDGDWSSANEYCEKVLDIDPKCAEAYLGKLMAELSVSTQEGLKDCDEPFDDNNNYKKAIRFADDKLRAELVAYVEHIKSRNEEARLSRAYNVAKNLMSVANTEDAYIQAAKAFEAIADYQDSTNLAKECYEKAEDAKEAARKDAILAAGKLKMGSLNVATVEEAIKKFESIPGWKDADICAITCRKKIEEIEADRLERERQAEADRKKAEIRAKRNKKIAIITTPILCAIVAFVIILNAVIIPNGKYNDAIALMDAGKYEEAIAAFEELDGYKDSADKASSIYLKYKAEKLKHAKVGDFVFFGEYEQDNDTSNGKEDIEWLVLEVKDGKALVISKYALDCKQYNTSLIDITWETCSLRRWLNRDFINSAFTAAEKAMIPRLEISADKNPNYSTNPGKVTHDQVFLLSITEANYYFSSDGARMCSPTDYAVANGASIDIVTCWWWLRSPGLGKSRAAGVDGAGSVYEYGNSVNGLTRAVRPAMWIDVDKSELLNLLT